MLETDYKTIAVMAEIYKISLRTLRFYEQRGLLQPIRIGQSRLYNRHQETRLQIIMKAKRLGFTLSEIDLLIEENKKSSRSDNIDDIVLKPEVIAEKISSLTEERVRICDAIDELKGSLMRA